MPPGGASAGVVVDPVPTAHLLLIREGTFTVRIDGSPYRLQAGDSLAFASPPAYAWRNEGTEPTRAGLGAGAAAARLTSHFAGA